MASTYLPTARTTPTRYRERASYDREVVHRILDESLICHLGYANAGRPVVLPTTHARRGETLYLHGSTGSGPMLAAKTESACPFVSPQPSSTGWCWPARPCTIRWSIARWW